MKNSKVLDQIRALMSKTVENGATESEMEQAMIMARKLMAKHQIDENEIVMSKNDIKLDSVLSSSIGEESANWQWDLLVAIGDGYNVRVLRKKAFQNTGYRENYFWRLIGFSEDVEVVKSTFEILVPFVRNLYKVRYSEYKKTTDSPIRYGVFVRNYIVGFTAGLQQKLVASKREIFSIAEEAQKYELMVVKKDALIEDYVKENLRVGKSVTTNRTRDVNYEAQMTGFNDGKTAEDKKQLH